MRRTAAAWLTAVLSTLSGAACALEAVLLPHQFDTPVFLAAPSGDSRLFVVEKAGRIRLVDNGVVSTYLDIAGLVNDSGERGLLGLAFDPGFANNGRFYVDYIDNNLNTVVSAFTAPSASASQVAPASENHVLTVQQLPGESNHKAGWIGFRNGDPGQLYVATGDGGSSNDPREAAQDLSNNLGKVLRVTPLDGGGYSVPANNPFVGVAGNDEIWAYGLRNPYRNSFDRSTGDFWIADVGQHSREEINFELAASAGGVNYGWRAREGSIDNPGVADDAPSGAVNPIFDYAHNSLGASIIGGYVYRGVGEAGLDGSYFFGDFASGRIFTLRHNGGTVADLTERTAELGMPFASNQLSSFGEDGLGNLYVMGVNGQVYRIAVAVPEPATWAMLLGGLLLVASAGKRRSAQRSLAR